MDSSEEADFYASHKDDPAVWGTPRRPARRAGRLSTAVAVRFTPEEIAELRAAAPDGNLSALIRQRSLGPRGVHK